VATRLWADLHVHIGSARGRPVKITASRDLTVDGLLEWARERKGLDVIGIVDAVSPLVLCEVEEMTAAGELARVPGGGLATEEGLLVLLGAEVETEEGAHFIFYLPDVRGMRELQRYLAPHITNPNLSTQKAGISVRELIPFCRHLGGMFCPAHAFTPHKGAYGTWVARLADGLGEDTAEVTALELGLSADAGMADMIAETARFNFVTNSDAHSLSTVGREYNLLEVQEPCFRDIKLALQGQKGRRVIANYGMHPRLGKYHRTYCPHCRLITDLPPPVLSCGRCGNPDVVLGVLDRVWQIRDFDLPQPPPGRPPYHYRVPLAMLPGLSGKRLDRLVQRCGTEIHIAECVGLAEIAAAVGEKVAVYIDKMRNNQLNIVAGGGGTYGKIQKD
jgi:uncharacterized protein (TIGR00375 family)